VNTASISKKVKNKNGGKRYKRRASQRARERVRACLLLGKFLGSKEKGKREFFLCTRPEWLMRTNAKGIAFCKERTCSKGKKNFLLMGKSANFRRSGTFNEFFGE